MKFLFVDKRLSTTATTARGLRFWPASVSMKKLLEVHATGIRWRSLIKRGCWTQFFGHKKGHCEMHRLKLEIVIWSHYSSTWKEPPWMANQSITTGRFDRTRSFFQKTKSRERANERRQSIKTFCLQYSHHFIQPHHWRIRSTTKTQQIHFIVIYPFLAPR